MIRDRTVHGRTAERTEVVRYGRSGKWYAEGEGWRRQITLAEAVELATEACGQAYLGRPGGARFDAEVRKARP